MRSRLHKMTQEISTHPAASSNWCLGFKVKARCSKSNARSSVLSLPHSSQIETPVFMPVGTQGTVKGLFPEQLEGLGYRLILGNTYHLGHRPVTVGDSVLASHQILMSVLFKGSDIVAKAGGLHEFMNWKNALLTDSGGFQMVSLSKLMSVEEEGVKFESPHTKEMMLLSPEKSMAIQQDLGADIIMQLDDVVHSTTEGPRVEEAMQRSIRWLDRCLDAHSGKKRESQNLFAIIQGGLDPDLRLSCLKEMTQRDVPGFAIGGLSGGEAKDQFWRMVHLSTTHLPKDKPRYCMGVGMAVDVVICCALGVDMFDCVFPTRTARFGCALVSNGQLSLRKAEFKTDFSPIDPSCPCPVCTRPLSRSYLNSIVTQEPIASHFLTVHNLVYMERLMNSIRCAINEDRFESFVQKFMKDYFQGQNYPNWVIDALQTVNITLLH